MQHRGRKNVYDLVPAPVVSGPRAARKRAAKTLVAAPDHLSTEMQAWYCETVAEYELDRHHLHLLRLAAEAFDRAQGARLQVIAEGTTFTDKNGNLRSHPSIAVERDARTSFAKLLKQLDLEPAKPDGRLGPRPGGGLGITFNQLTPEEDG